MTTPEHTISALCKRSRDISLEKGWLNPDGTDPRPFHTVITLFHSELSEAFEEVRGNKPLDAVWYEVRGQTISRAERLRSVEPPASDVGAFKPAGVSIELADFVIRVCQWVGSAGYGEMLQEHIVPALGTWAERSVEELLADLHFDVSQAYEVSMSDHGTDVLLSGLANSLNTVFAFCKNNGIDLWAAIDEKEAYNRTRPTRHGGKSC